MLNALIKINLLSQKAEGVYIFENYWGEFWQKCIIPAGLGSDEFYPTVTLYILS
jgi:hypothetical protein